MNNRERTLAIFRRQHVDRLPAVHFGFWGETVAKFLAEKRFTLDETGGEFPHNNTPAQAMLAKKLGFDFNWEPFLPVTFFLDPPFERERVGETADGTPLIRNQYGAVEVEIEGAGGIPAEVDHLLKDRDSYEKYYRERLKYSDRRIPVDRWRELVGNRAFDWGENPVGLFAGSLFGRLRNAMGLEGVSLLYYDDEALFAEMIDTVGELTRQCVERQLTLAGELGFTVDYVHFWEDICFRNGPLVHPEVFRKYVAPHYRRINEYLHRHGVNYISVDCDGDIRSLAPIWLENGVNVMFPIEIGTWNGNYAELERCCGREILGVGGASKFVFAGDYGDVDREIERLKPLIAEGGFIPCPDHRIPPDARWENIQYYCDRIKELKI